MPLPVKELIILKSINVSSTLNLKLSTVIVFNLNHVLIKSVHNGKKVKMVTSVQLYKLNPLQDGTNALKNVVSLLQLRNRIKSHYKSVNSNSKIINIL